MKKGVYIVIIIVLILIIVGIVAYPYIFTNKNTKRCIKEGKIGYPMNNDTCCEGLGIMSLSAPSPDGKVCSVYGTQFTCSRSCGNGECDDKENYCNCERDCKEASVCGNGICENGEGPACPTCDTLGNCGCIQLQCYTDGNHPPFQNNNYTCPALKGISCMPIVLDEFVQYCSGEYHNWIIENCNVSFSY